MLCVSSFALEHDFFVSVIPGYVVVLLFSVDQIPAHFLIVPWNMSISEAFRTTHIGESAQHTVST